MTSNSSATNQVELKHIAAIVRALVTSRKPPCYLHDVLREYSDVESNPLPYKSLGYNTAQELLEDTGEFIFAGARGSQDVIITAKHSTKTAHIASMVRGQKPSKAGRIGPLKTVKQPTQQQQPSDRRPESRFNGSGDRNNNSNNINNRGNILQPSKQHTNVNSNPQNQYLQRQKSVPSAGQPKDLREMLNSKKTQKSTESQQFQAKSLQSMDAPKPNGPRAILGASKQIIVPKEALTTSGSKRQQKELQQSTAKPAPSAATPLPTSAANNTGLGANLQQRLNANRMAGQPVVQMQKTTNANQPQVAPPSNLAARLQKPQYQAAPAPLSVSVPVSTALANDVQGQSLASDLKCRLKVYHGPDSNNQANKLPASNKYTSKADATNHSAPQASLQDELQSRVKECRLKVYHGPDNANQNSHFNAYPTKGNSYSQSADFDAVKALEQYCASKNYPPPQFSSFQGKFSRGTVSCRVVINGNTFTTYPNEYETEAIAQRACAKHALEKIQMQNKKRPLPVCSFSERELLQKLYAELLNRPHGIFAKNFPEFFETTFHQSLPDNWWAMIQTSSLFITETELNKVIVFANKDADLTTSEKAEVIQIDPIRLPWAEEHWYIFIRHCSSTVEVWGRLFGDDYNERFTALLNDIDVYMATKKERPLAITRKNIYLVYLNDCWHRVRVEELDKSKGSALCFFIDFGDADWLTVDQLYICETQFLGLPAQAVPFSLYGLEDFEGHPMARKCLDDLLSSSKCVVGRIFTKESEFYDANSKFYGKIQVVIFDTSKQEDINLNQQLSNAICQETAGPEIKQKTVTNVIVTNVNDKGDIFLQLNGPDLKYVQNLLQLIVETKLIKIQHKISAEDFNRCSMFLVCDDDDVSNVKWYRATLAGLNAAVDSEKFPMAFVDHGVTKLIDISNIFMLESLSMALSSFPAQAIKVRLHNIPEITRNVVETIRSLLPKGCEALARLVETGPVPLVTIYTRLDGPGRLCTINDVLRIEHELKVRPDLLPGGAAGSDEATPSAKFSLDFSAANRQGNASSGSLASPSTPTGNAFIDVTRGLTLTTMPGSPQKPSELPKLSNYTAIPKVGGYFEVRITMSANPSNFTIQPYKDYPNLNSLMKDLQTFCESNDEFIPTDMVEVGEAFAARNPDGYFHRVTVVKKYGDVIHVLFCDFGDTATVESSQLKTLPLKFRQLPKMAIQAKLYGIKAATGDWTLDDCLFFRKLTVGQTFVSVIKNISYDKDNSPPSQILELELIDVATDDDVYIHDVLLQQNRAIIDA